MPKDVATLLRAAARLAQCKKLMFRDDIPPTWRECQLLLASRRSVERRTQELTAAHAALTPAGRMYMLANRITIC